MAAKGWITGVRASTAFIKPGSPWENGYVESFNGTLRDELLRKRQDIAVEIETLRAAARPRHRHRRRGPYHPPVLAGPRRGDDQHPADATSSWGSTRRHTSKLVPSLLLENGPMSQRQVALKLIAHRGLSVVYREFYGVMRNRAGAILRGLFKRGPRRSGRDRAGRSCGTWRDVPPAGRPSMRLLDLITRRYGDTA